MTTKLCTKCSRSLPADSEHFVRDKNSKDGWYLYCKDCRHASVSANYRANLDVNRRKSAGAHNKLKARNRKFVQEFLQQSKCIDCGDTRWQVLDFDHVRGVKKYNVSECVWQGLSLQAIQTEIEKCEVRCANCHRLRTAIQFGWWTKPHLS